MFNYDMIAKIYPVAFAASQGLDFHHDGSDKQFYGSRIDTNYLNYQNQDCFKQVLFVRSEPRPPVCTTQVPSSELNEKPYQHDEHITDDIDVDVLNDELNLYLNEDNEEFCRIEESNWDHNNLDYKLNNINNVSRFLSYYSNNNLFCINFLKI